MNFLFKTASGIKEDKKRVIKRRRLGLEALEGRAPTSGLTSDLPFALAPHADRAHVRKAHQAKFHDSRATSAIQVRMPSGNQNAPDLGANRIQKGAGQVYASAAVQPGPIKIEGKNFLVIRGLAFTYQQAKTYAANTYYGGRQGRLAVLDTDAKFNGVVSHFGSYLDDAYVGATRNNTPGATDKTFYWSNSKVVSNKYFLAGQPDNSRGLEWAAQMRLVNGKVALNDVNGNIAFDNAILVMYDA